MQSSVASSGKSSPKSLNTQNQLSSSRTSPYLSSLTSKHAMDAPTFIPQAQSFRQMNGIQQSPFPLSTSTMNAFERESSANSKGNSSGACTILIRRLPLKTTEDSLRSMVVWSKDFIEAEVMSPENNEDPGFRSAILRFQTPAGAQEAQRLLNGKPNISNDAQMIVQLLEASPSFSRRYTSPTDTNGSYNGGPASSTSSASSSGPAPRQSSRFNGTFQTMEKISPSNIPGAYASKELPNPESSTHYQSLFSPQSPIGNHLNERTRISGKTLINNDSVDDDETGELLKDPVAYAENGSSSVQTRRSTNSQLPISRLAGLSLNTNHAPVPASLSGYASAGGILPMQPVNHAMSPTLMSAGGPQMQYQINGQQTYPRHSFPTANPADQNPPCNTLYVGNLPIDTSEDELKATFSKQRGYKRLCFRTKQNGPMCFVEFEDVSFATKALHELYGHVLHNSIKGGIRLSFSKNPLGVRSGQGPGVPGPNSSPGIMQNVNGMVNGGSTSGYSASNGPPPGLSAPPGLGPSRVQYSAVMNPMLGGSDQYNSANYSGTAYGWPGHLSNSQMGAASPGASMNGTMNGASNSFPPAYMMGR